LGIAEFATDDAAAPAQKSYDFTDGLFGFQDAVILESIFSAKVFCIWKLELGGLAGQDVLTSSVTCLIFVAPRT
jgi:hypothetical protein